jgi:hypothetical protein
MFNLYLKGGYDMVQTVDNKAQGKAQDGDDGANNGFLDFDAYTLEEVDDAQAQVDAEAGGDSLEGEVTLLATALKSFGLGEGLKGGDHEETEDIANILYAGLLNEKKPETVTEVGTPSLDDVEDAAPTSLDEAITMLGGDAAGGDIDKLKTYLLAATNNHDVEEHVHGNKDNESLYQGGHFGNFGDADKGTGNGGGQAGAGMTIGGKLMSAVTPAGDGSGGNNQSVAGIWELGGGGSTTGESQGGGSTEEDKGGSSGEEDNGGEAGHNH